jgi:hypothetical protein
VGLLITVASWLVSNEFGKVVITLRDGSKIYAVREARGLSYEQISLTRNSDGCISADPDNDYIRENPAESAILYSITSDGIMLYDDPFTRYIQEPTSPWADIKVVINRSRRPSERDVHSDPQKYGATLVKIPLNETCWKNLFRRGHRPQ